jgi:TonB family protein
MEPYRNILVFLADVTVRSLVLVTLAAGIIPVFRIRTAASRHAIWTMATVGTLLLAVLAPMMPPVSLRVLRPAPAVNVDLLVRHPDPPSSGSTVIVAASVARESAPPTRPVWPVAAAALYVAAASFLLIRMAFGYLFTLRLVRASRPVQHPWARGIYESAWISVPLTVGWLRPRILLPAGWETWESGKLQAVLAHERTHIARRDWAISMLAGWNRCLFWFNPVAWWLERNLSLLAEQACDDSALLLVRSDHYAQALLDMAAAVKTCQGRLVWEAIAMAQGTEVKKRIERILDETRQLPKAWTRSRWIALLACSLPLVYVTSVVRLTAQEPKTPAAMNEYLKGKRQFTPADVSTIEQYLVTNPHDLDIRSQIILYYYSNGMKQQRLAHILWLIANHSESDAAAFSSMGLSPRPNPLNDAADYNRAAGLWRQQVEAHPNDARVLGNAAQFLAQPGGDLPEAERLLLRARAIENGNVKWVGRLAELYAKAILGATGDPQFASVDADFASRIRTQLETSVEFPLVQMVGSRLTSVAMRAPVAAGVLNLDDHPLLVPAIDFGGRLLARGREVAQSAPVTQSSGSSGFQPVTKVDPVYPPLARQARIQGDVHLQCTTGPDGHVINIRGISGHPLLMPAAIDAVQKWVFPAGAAGQFVITVPFRLDGAVSPMISQGQLFRPAAPVTSPQAAQAPEPEGPPPVSKIDPAYPPLARQARIQGDVRLRASAGPDGHVTHLEVISGHPLLVPAAIEAVKQWVFPSATPERFVIVVPFRLDGGNASLRRAQPEEAAAMAATRDAMREVFGQRPGPPIEGVVGGIPQDARGGVVGGVANGVVGGVIGGVPGGAGDRVGPGVFRVGDGVGAWSASWSRDGAGQVRLRISGKALESRLIQKVDPVYPAEARAAGISGNVTLEVTIGPDGHVDNVKPLDGHPLLAAAAQDAVKQWVYQPTLLQEKSATVVTTVTLTFDLNQ